jgi:DNA polymerase-3 subunit alpha
MNIKHALSVRSDFSLGDATFQVDKMIEQAKALGYESVALVDIMSISNMVSFTEKAKKAGIKPIVGVTVRVYDDPTYRKPGKDKDVPEKANPFFWLKVYARNEKGMLAIIKMLSKANSPDYFYYHPRVGLQEILELTDVVISTGDFYNLFHSPDHEKILEALMITGNAPFVEIVPIATPLWRRLNGLALEAALKLDLPILPTIPVMYPQDGADTADVMRAIATNAKVDSPWLSIPYVRDFHMKPPIELAKAMKAEAPGVAVHALGNLEKFAGLCTYEFKKLPPSLPTMAPDEFAAVVDICRNGFKERLLTPVLGYQPAAADLPTYKERLQFELATIAKMKFSGYFLLVRDIVVWAKSQGIIVGPGRGSVGGSLVAYLMGITDVDPIRFNLLFERFINPGRIDLPDADLDFMSCRREEVIAYIVEKYGADKVAGISNYNALGAASALRDVSRVHNLEPVEYSCSKLVEKVHGVAQSLEESAVVVPDIEKFKGRHPTIWKHATSLEGALRGYGQHAAGVVVAGEPLINRAVVETRSGRPVVNWDKKYVEEWGLIKMDVLGLTTLDMLALGAAYVKERHGKTIDYLKLPLDDARVLEQFAKGNTKGVFQFESSGMVRLLRELAMGGPLSFDDLVAVVALFRPGPLDAGLCDDYIQIKQGIKTASLEHPNMAAALKDTHGVIVYQEQIMQVCRDLAGFTFEQADNVRKAMGKKDKKMMAEWEERFVNGCVTFSGMDKDKAGELWKKIEVFAGYAFNKSHSVEYSIISYWTMWLKVNYPAEYFAATMTVVEDDDKIEGLVLDARKNGLEVLPPDINKSSDRIEIVGERTLYAPFQAVKGISSTVAGYIIKTRRELGKPIAERSDFYAALTASGIGGKVNKTHRERLEKLGAFAECEGDKKGAMHPDRLRDRLEFLPGYTVDVVKADRAITADRMSLIKVVRLAEDARSCDKCSLKGNAHPLPRVGKAPKFMVVFDSPNFHEERAGKLREGDNGKRGTEAMKEAGLSAQDGYFTTLVKSGKPKGAKGLTNEQINGCSDWLRQELEILKPPVIVAMGSAAVRFFAPEVKGGPAELAGKHAWDPKLDATIVFGINPSMIFFDPSRLPLLKATFARVYELLT